MKTSRSYSAIGLALLCLAFLGASCNEVGDGGIFRTDDDGVTWEQKVFIGQENRRVITINNVDIQTIEVDPTDSDIVYVGTRENGIYKTDNGGEVWWQLPVSPARIRDIAIDPQNPEVIYAVKNATILKSTDSGDNWEIVYTDTQNAIITRLTVDWYDSDKIVAITSIGSVLISEDEGANWQVVYQVEEPLIGIQMSHEDSRVMYIAELEEAVHKSVDGGKTWTNLMDNKEFDEFAIENEISGADKVVSISMDPNNADVLYAVTEGGLLATRDAARTWEIVDTLIERGADQNAEIRAFTVQPDDSNTIYFGVRNLIHKTEDGGNTWKTIEDFPSQRRIMYLWIDPRLLSQYPLNREELCEEANCEDDEICEFVEREAQCVSEDEEENQEASDEEGETEEEEIDVVDRRLYIGVEKIEEKRSGFFGGPPIN